MYTRYVKQVSRVSGRDAQRRRTRKAILDAASELLSHGEKPSINDIAKAADVSRRTVYMYFSTLEHLMIDATAGMLSGDAGVDLAIDHSSPDAHARVDALAVALHKLTDQTLPLGRRLIALTVENPPAVSRGHRRIQWIESALAPLRKKLKKELFDRLVSGLAVVLGWEASIVLRDVRAAGPEREARVQRWAAAALLDAILREARGG